MNQINYRNVNLAGIVDKVRAVRSGDEVQYLEATIHIKMGDDYVGAYGGGVTVDLPIPLPVTSDINPGDLVTATLTFANPHGRRFIGALTVGNEEPDAEGFDEDAEADLDIMVEDSMIQEAKATLDSLDAEGVFDDE